MLFDASGSKVAVGEELEATGLLHGIQMSEGYSRIAVVEVLNGAAPMIKPTEEASTLGEARGQIIQWPKRLLKPQVSPVVICVSFLLFLFVPSPKLFVCLCR